MIKRPTPYGRAAEAEPSGSARAAARPSSARRRRLRWRAVLAGAALLAAAIGAAGCGSPADAGEASPATLDVFAASSLTEVFTQLGDDFTAAHPDVKVVCNFAGSSDLVTQLQQGASADVFASADTANMEKAGDLAAGAEIFAGNTLAIAVEQGNPEHITGLADLDRDDLKVVLAAPDVPAGKYAGEILDDAGVSVDPVSLEVSVKGVVTKISLGEADAGIVYVTDVAAAKGKIDSVAIPEEENVIASYPIATLTGSDDQGAAQAFVDLVLSDEGQQVLADYGFLPPPAQ